MPRIIRSTFLFVWIVFFPARLYPQTGQFIPQLARLDTAVADFIEEWGVPGASVAVVKDERLIYARGFGYADQEGDELVEPYHLFRLASVSKPITSIAIMKLWDEDLLDLFNIPPSILPEVKSSSEIYGETAPGMFDSPIPICGIAGDQQAALFGQMCISEGMIKNTYGTGCFIMMNTGEKPIFSKNNLLTTIGWVYDNKTIYALEGSIFIGGAVVQWLRDGLKIIGDAKEVEKLAGTVEDNGGVYLVPAFTGLGAPYWDQYARGTIVGITRGTTDAHIARAALESIAYQTKDVLDAMLADSDIAAKQLRVDGGASVNRLLMQFQSDILGLPVIRPNILETTAMGAGFFAGLATGFWKSIADINSLWQEDTAFHPNLDPVSVEGMLRDWNKAVDRSKSWSR